MYERLSRVKPTQGCLVLTLGLSLSRACATVNGNVDPRLLAEKLLEILYKANHDNERRPHQSDKKEKSEEVHTEMRDRAHVSIVWPIRVFQTRGDRRRVLNSA